ncbi:FMN-binding glutamate synthase family protein [Pseudomaricurvus alcaniphilus]|uniref:FMN-binding glutamate synthase family protein n=1 Tax=Pseudomaricurvus alcaniphilus TaxID=1166482 RepID=UPI0014073914|nr:FMN-binding glutamate synthase family protein [Pseudomaricurvus alcaniphilus]NHN35713.1 FMN-binding glutamate synthase family protein [Pseudomaricurvus alcaniphilus]
MEWLPGFVASVVQIGALVFVCALGILLLLLAYIYVVDVTQKTHAIRRNYPIIGRFRYYFEHMGEFFRQYFFALDREELPFNRAQRSWIYRAAKNIDSTVAFGSTRPLNHPGDIIFLNCLFPTLRENFLPSGVVTIGDGYTRQPYTPNSIFNISGMSFGALSVPAITALSSGAKQAGIWLNTGEGGLSPFHLQGGCDLVFQIGTAKYGVQAADGSLDPDKLAKIAAHDSVKMFELKLSQGAKPGKGGILPGVKVTSLIASTRGIPEGQPSISPNGHPEVRSIEDLLEFLRKIREITGKPTGFKMVLGSWEWLDELGQCIHERGLEYAPDFITVDSADGGTGAAPQSLMDYMGLPIKRSLPMVVDKLSEYGLRERVKVICSGKMTNPGEVAWALCMGADFVVSARGFMFALGCIQAMQCNKNTCPTGVTTHNPELQKGLDPANKANRVANYAKNLLQEIEVIAHSCGVAQPRLLQRRHAQVINGDGVPVALNEIYPEVETRAIYLARDEDTAESA